MQAESRKVGQKFDFTNNLISEHKLFIKIAKRFNIFEDSWKYILYYNPKMSNGYVKQCELEFRRELKTNRYISHIKSKTLKKPAFAIYINSSILGEMMISILLTLRSEIAKSAKQKTMTRCMKDFTIGFLSKDLLGDGSVIYNKANKSIVVEISEEDKNSQNDIANMFKYFGISINVFRNKIRLSSNLRTILWLLNIKAFKGHRNREKLINSVRKKTYFRYFYSRFKFYDKCTKYNFSDIHGLSLDASAMYLYRNTRKGLLEKKGIYYKLSGTGRKIVNTIREAENELTIL